MTQKTITQPAVSFGLPIDPMTMDTFADRLPRLDEAEPGDIVGMNCAIYRLSNSVETNGASFIVMRADRGFEHLSAEEIRPDQYGLAYPLLARFAHADFDNVLSGIDLEESSEDGWHLLSLSIFNRAVIVSDTIHDLAPVVPEDLAPNTRLWLPAAVSAHEAFALQPFVDAALAYFERETLIDGLDDAFEYERVALPFRAEVA